MAHFRFVVNFEMKTPTRHMLALWVMPSGHIRLRNKQ